ELGREPDRAPDDRRHWVVRGRGGSSPRRGDGDCRRPDRAAPRVAVLPPPLPGRASAPSGIPREPRPMVGGRATAPRLAPGPVAPAGRGARDRGPGVAGNRATRLGARRGGGLKAAGGRRLA